MFPILVVQLTNSSDRLGERPDASIHPVTQLSPSRTQRSGFNPIQRTVVWRPKNDKTSLSTYLLSNRLVSQHCATFSPYTPLLCGIQFVTNGRSPTRLIPLLAVEIGLRRARNAPVDIMFTYLP